MQNSRNQLTPQLSPLEQESIQDQIKVSNNLKSLSIDKNLNEEVKEIEKVDFYIKNNDRDHDTSFGKTENSIDPFVVNIKKGGKVKVKLRNK